jgi:hypothetical protein
MSYFSRDFADILVSRNVINAEQLAEARVVARQTGERIEDVLVRLGYVTAREVAIARAEALGVAYLDLSEATIPPGVIELVPESVARENVVLPLCATRKTITIVTSDPADGEMIQKLQFILNMHVIPVLAPCEQIVEAINRHYGPTETESVDSMLAEFTDSAIDFTEAEAAGAPCIDLEMVLPTTGPALAYAGVLPLPPPSVERRATVRYYHRMNPERMFPLLVILSPKEIQAVVQRGVSQARSEAFHVEEGSLVEIEPVLPGCACYPPREQLRIAAGEVGTTFWVVPHVLGKVMHARVVIRQDGQTLAEVSLEARVVKQSMTFVVGGLSLVLPFGLLLLKHFKLDFESQLEDGFSLYAQVAGWLLRSLTPERLTGLLLALTASLYLCLRPRRRDVFWDVRPVASQETEPLSVEPPRPDHKGQIDRARQAFDGGNRAEGERLLVALLETDPFDVPALLCLADGRYKFGDHAGALLLYQRAMVLGPMRAIHYFRSSLAASKLDDNTRAMRILEQAAAILPAAQMKGPMWYNMGCFAARLGRYPDALRFLNQAIDSGFDKIEMFRTDPDLEPLRWHAGFKRLLAGLVDA